ncbi:MAG: carbohydrate porin [Polyangiaceae bacterium]
MKGRATSAPLRPAMLVAAFAVAVLASPSVARAQSEGAGGHAEPAATSPNATASPVAGSADASPSGAASTSWPAGSKRVVPVASAAPAAGEATATDASTGRFEFGSYGRVNVASDGRGGTGRNADIVAFGSRLDEDSYAELELRREDKWSGGIDTRIVTTLALLPPFFHFSGKPDTTIAVRQLYAQGALDGWTLWGGARMVRGDDVYLMNFWPLDNQNTIGGGVTKTLASDTQIALHAGMQRLDNPYQFQELPAAIPYGVGATNITVLDRPRTIETLKVTQLIRNDAEHVRFTRPGLEKAGFKAVVYGEAHQISAGARRDTNTNQDVSLPSDTGWMLGSQLTFYTGKRDTFATLVMRHARGLAAYDPLAAPDTFANDRTTSGASETRIVLSENCEIGDWGFAAAGYLRWFRDAGPSATSLSKYDEGNIVVRPQWYFAEHFGLAVEGSYQARRYAVLAPDGSGPLTGCPVRGAVLPNFSPAGRGLFKRPIIGLVYMATSRDSGARALYPEGDVFGQRRLEHYAGLTVEWWFNSSSYP